MRFGSDAGALWRLNDNEGFGEMLGYDKKDAWSRAKTGFLEADESYCRRRATEERARALEAFEPRVRQVHLDMAARYEDLARAIEMFEHHLDRKLNEVA